MPIPVTEPAPAQTSHGDNRALAVVGLCLLVAIFDGYDIIVYGAAVPGLLAEPDWDLSATTVGLIGGLTAIGMLVGALISGPMADRIGRRRLIITAVAWFSLFTAACALAPTPELLGLLRFLAGLGLGGVLPSAIALTVEFAPAGRRQLFNALASTGFPLGGILAGAMALLLLPHFSWRALFLVGLAPTILVLPIALAWLPESPGHLMAKGRREEAETIARRFGLDTAAIAAHSSARQEVSGLRGVFTARQRGATAVFCIASFCCLMLAYGLNTWLPEMMRRDGYALGTSLQFLLALNLGAAVLGTLAALVADRWGPKIATAASFAAAAMSLLVLGLRPESAFIALAVAVAGLGGTGTLVLINGYVAAHYHVSTRASALGVVLAAGRLGAIGGPLLGGFLNDSRLAVGWNFVIFAIPAVLGVAVICLGPRREKPTCVDLDAFG